MSGPRRGLGRGLGTLIPTSAPTSSAATQDPVGRGSELATVDGATFAELPVESITPNQVQPRTVFDEEAMAELVASIKEVGLLQPIVVRETTPGAYELIMGERRWRAHKAAGLETIGAIVRSTEDTDMLRDALLENLHRAELNPLEEAAAYQQLLSDFGCTQEELATRIGRSRPQISNTIRLLRLSPSVQNKVAAGVLSAGHARALLALDDSAAQDSLASRVIAEGISVRTLEEIISVGDPDSPRRRGPRGPTLQAPGLREVATRLGDVLETKVEVTMGKKTGKVAITFADLGDLQRIITIIEGR
ncbi:MAG: ParB/RepB/Spo0J family partition protein [Nocardioides sp.]